MDSFSLESRSHSEDHTNTQAFSENEITPTTKIPICPLEWLDIARSETKTQKPSPERRITQPQSENEITTTKLKIPSCPIEWLRGIARSETQTQNHPTGAESRNNQELLENVLTPTATKSICIYFSISFENSETLGMHLNNEHSIAFFEEWHRTYPGRITQTQPNLSYASN